MPVARKVWQLQNGGTLEHAQTIANHESPRTTKLYDRTREELTFEEVERIKIDLKQAPIFESRPFLTPRIRGKESNVEQARVRIAPVTGYGCATMANSAGVDPDASNAESIGGKHPWTARDIFLTV